MKTAIVGSGAMGILFASAMTRAGMDVVLVGRSSALAAKLNAEGATIIRDGTECVTRIASTTDPASLGPVDVVLFAVKSYQTQSAAQLARPLVSPCTVVATLQNGIGTGRVLAELFDSTQIVVGLTNESATVLAPAVVTHPGSALSYVGPYIGDSVSGSRLLADGLMAGGFAVTVTTDIETEMWRKLIFVAAANPTAALARMTCGELTRDDAMHLLVNSAATEAVHVARAEGHDISVEERLSYIHHVLAAASAAKASMVQDIEARRRTEIDAINGVIVATAAVHGICVPINQALTTLIKGWERTTLTKR